MFDIGWTELIVVAAVAILVVGPKELPRMLRTFGQVVGKVRRMAGEFQSTFNDAVREAERQADLDDVKKSVGDLKSLNPLEDVKASMNPLEAIEGVSDPTKSYKPQVEAAKKAPDPADVAVAEMNPEDESDYDGGDGDGEPEPHEADTVVADTAAEANKAKAAGDTLT